MVISNVWTLSVLMATAVLLPSSALSTTKSTDETSTATQRFPRKWIARLFYETLVDFAVAEGLGSSVCQMHTQMYRKHLANDTNWAVQMSDSWSRYPNGLLVGNSHHMGVYEECVEVHLPVRGKYCVPTVHLQSAASENSSVGKPFTQRPYGHAWNEIIGFKDYDLQSRRNDIKFGVCIPDSCTAEDLETSLQREFDDNFLPHQIKATVHVDSILCSTDQDTYPYDTGYYFTSSLLTCLILLCCLSTTFHFLIIMQSKDSKKTGNMPEILTYFSFIHNGRELIKYNERNELNIFNGIKVGTMILVLFGHKFLYFIINPQTYPKEIEKIYIDGPDFLLTCSNLIDPFFYMAGYLMYAILTSQFNKPNTNWLHVPMVIIYKYLKIIPALAMMMLLTAFIIPHMGSGPFWAMRMWTEADKCKKYWWTNFLAISNFIDVENQCLIVSWYISCLLQFVIIGTIVVYVRVKNRKVGIFIIVIIFLLSLVVSFVVTYTYQAYGIVRIMYSFMESPSNSFEFSNLYRPFYLRGTPFYAGMLAGITVEMLKKRKIKFSMLVTYLTTVSVAVVSLWVQLYSASFYKLDRPYNVLEQSVYAAIGHCTWAAILFCVTVFHFTSGYGPIEKLLNNRLMVPLGRLSYSVYLVNITIMMMIESRQSVSVSPTFMLLTDGWIVGTARTYFAGMLLYMVVEAPTGQLVKKLLYPKKKKDQPSQVDLNNRLDTTEQNNSTHF